MRFASLSTAALLGLGLAGIATAQAESITDPVSIVGVIGTHNEYKTKFREFDSGTSKTRVNQYGLFYNYGNKLTGGEGLIYQGGVEAQYGKKSGVKFEDVRIEGEAGYRMAVDATSYFDVLGGLGYRWDRTEDKVRVGGDKVRIRLDNKNPYVKLGAGYNYLTPDMTVRFEVGGRYTFKGKVKTKNVFVDGTKRVDLKDRLNPYAELGFMWNKGIGNFPVYASVFYEHDTYRTKHKNEWGGLETKDAEYGFKLGMAF